MSTPKVYEIAFRLGASMSSSVRTAFAKANQEVKGFAQTAEKAQVVAARKMSLVASGIAGVTSAAGSATVAVGALGASFAAAGIGAFAFGAVATSVLGNVFNASKEVAKLEEKIANADSAKERIAAQKELAQVYASMNKEQAGALKSLQGFKTFWGGFVKQFQNPIFDAFSSSLNLTKNILNGMAPTIDNVAKMISGLMESLNKKVESGGMKEFFAWMEGTAAGSLESLLTIAGNTFAGLFGLFRGFAPLSKDMEGGLVALTGRFKEWAANLGENNGFQKFIAYVQTNGPTLLRIIGNVGTFIKNLVVFLAPLGAVVLNIVDIITGFAAKLISVFKTILPIVMPIISNIISFVGDMVKQIAAFWNENGAQIMQAVQNVFSGINKVIQFLAPVILFILNSVWGNVKGVIQGALKIIMGAIKIFAGLFTGDFSKMWEGIKQLFFGAIQFVWNAINLLFVGKILGSIKALASKSLSSVGNMWTKIKDFFAGGATAIWQRIVGLGSKIQTGFTTMKDKAVNIAKSMWARMKEIFGNIVDGAKALPGKIGQGIKSMAGKALEGAVSMGNRLLRGIGKIVNGVIKGLNWVMAKVGLDISINQWEVPQYARGTNNHPGGPAIVGERGRELINANGQTFLANRQMMLNLPKGASVLPNRQTEQLLAAGIPGYANGVGNFLTDAWEGTKKVAGKVKDIGLDIWSYVSEPSKLFTKVLEKFGVEIPSFAGAFGNIASGAFNLLKEKGLGFLTKKLSDFGSTGGFKGGAAAPDQVKAWVMKALAITGTPMSWLPSMLVKAQKESGFNPRAINLWDINAKRGTPSKGLFQTIDPTFNAYKMPGMNDIYNPIHNAVAAIRYIKSRYGTVFNTPGIRSMAKGGAYKGYYQGGKVPNSQWAWVGERGPELLKLPGGSNVFSNGKSKEMLSGLSSYAQSGDSPSTQTSRISESPMEVIYSPQYIIQGNVDKTAIENVTREDYERFKQFMKQWKRDEKRLAFE